MIIWRIVQFLFQNQQPSILQKQWAKYPKTEEFYNTQSTSWWNDAGQLLENTLKGEDSSVVEHHGGS